MNETIISRFFANADRLGQKPIYHFNVDGRWFPIGWRTEARLVRDFAAGLVELGHQQGTAVAVLSSARREWMTADLGNLAAGGVTIGVYPTMTADQTRYVIAHCDAKFVVVENAKQLAKVESVRAQLPLVKTVIVLDPTGCKLSESCISLRDLLARGHASSHDVTSHVAALRLEDAAIFVYTSGTTGPPKGAMLNHGNIVAALNAFSAIPSAEGDHMFAFLPLAHVLQRMVNYRGLWEGTACSFARSLETVAEDLGATHPTLVASVPRIFEKIHVKVHEQAAAGSEKKKKIFDWALGVGREVSRLRHSYEPIPAKLEMQHKVAKALVFDKLRAKMGGRIKLFLTGGAPIAKEILEFFDAADITIIEGWAMTETCAAGTVNLPGAIRFGSIGRPLAGVEMRLDDDGEILVRGPAVFSGYYKDDEATRASFTKEGFFRTGDIGRVDSDGYYYIIDRKKDLIITALGKNIAPQNIECLVKTDPRISQVMCVGDRRSYMTALIAVTPELRAAHSEAELTTLVGQIVATKNEELASYERIKKFRLLPGELTQEEGELTPTLKVKRKIVTEKYAALIEDMYTEKARPEGEQASPGRTT
jgi:long-chain acyl-CoA synthetase